jgi:adenylate kinase
VPRADDQEAVVRKRLEVYRKQTEPLVAFYRDRPTFKPVDGARLVDDVTAGIVAAVESALE